jgi:sugar-specific transcriptional regulator TrmB
MTQKMTQFKEDEILQNLGLDERQSLIYLTLLENGPLLPQGVAKKTGIKRSTLYLVFPEMLQKGILGEVTLGKRNLLQAISPDVLFEEQERKFKDLKEGMAELLSLYRIQGIKPKVSVYEGFEGVKRVFMDMLERGHERCGFDRIAKYDKRILDWVVRYFVPKRIKLGLKVRAIVTEEKLGREYMARGKEYLRETRFVPLNKFPFTACETWVYGNKISFMTIKEKGPLMGVIIESKDLSQNLRALFELAWEGAEKYQKK